MKVILLQNVPKLGQKNDIKNVSEGYARNMLFPRGLAKPADSGTLKNIQTKNQIKNKQAQSAENRVAVAFKKLAAAKIIIKEKANEKGSLFAQVHLKEIAAAANSAGIPIEENWIKLENPIKEVGETTVNLEALGQKGQFVVEVVGK